MTDIVKRLTNWAGRSQTENKKDCREAAAEIERLRLYERYANSPIEGMVEEAIAYKKEHGKYPFED